MKTESFHKHEVVTVINIDPLPGNTVAPPLRMGAALAIKEVITDRNGNQHIDVGLASNYNYITSYETKEELPRGDSIHWCHPSRFKKL